MTPAQQLIGDAAPKITALKAIVEENKEEK